MLMVFLISLSSVTGQERDIILNVGDGIKQLLGITSGEFTEELFQGMIEEIIPLGEDIPADRAESREKIMNGGIQKYKAEILVTIPGGEKKWIKDSSVPVIDDKTGKVIGSIRDFLRYHRTKTDTPET